MKIRNRFLNWCIASAATVILRTLFLTVRFEYPRLANIASPYTPPEGKTRYCFCLWHDAIVACLFSAKTYNLAGLISRHQDGSYLTYAIRKLGLTPVRGSASRGGAQATKQLIEQSDLHVCITPDGPRGPRREMKDGIVYLASRTGRPIVPGAVTGTRFWAAPAGWSDLVIPMPFSKVIVLAGDPVEVSPDLTREEISGVTSRIQKEMDRLEGLVQRYVNGDVEVLSEFPGHSEDVETAAAA